jgi:hypothetical protein
MDTKLCKRCQQNLPLDRFKIERAVCRSCTNIEQRAKTQSVASKLLRRIHRLQPYVCRRQREQARISALRYPERTKARRTLYGAIEYGRITRPENCSRCGAVPWPQVDGRSAIEAHHRDYSKPLEVEWFCAPCHRLIDFGRKGAGE